MLFTAGSTGRYGALPSGMEPDSRDKSHIPWVVLSDTSATWLPSQSDKVVKLFPQVNYLIYKAVTLLVLVQAYVGHPGRR